MTDNKRVKEDLKCPRCGLSLQGLEYAYDFPEHYDGISEWQCPNQDGCGYRRGRFTGRELSGFDYEKRADIMKALYAKR